MSRLAVAIAAGGSSRRLGFPKPFVDLGGTPLLEYALEYASGISYEVYLLARDQDQFRGFVFKSGIAPGIIIDSDRGTFPDRVVESLRKIPSEIVFLMGCDTPFLDPSLPALLASRIGDHGAAIPSWRNGYVEPLAAIYSVSRLPEARGLGSMIRLCWHVDPVLVDIEGSMIPPWTFLNINTGEDLSRAKSLLRLFRSRRSSCGRSNTPRCPTTRCL